VIFTSTHTPAPECAIRYSGTTASIDGFTFRSGVTTVVDAGSAAGATLRTLKIASSIVPKLGSLLAHIVAMGWAGEPSNKTLTIGRQGDGRGGQEVQAVVVGIKTAHYDGPEWTRSSVRSEAGTLAGIPVMVVFGRFGPSARSRTSS